MESTIQINSQQLNGQVEFQFVRNTYPLDDKLYCYYTIPVNGTFRPEHGDFIGILPVGWTGLNEVRCKKMISVEEFGYNQETGCGHVVFEPFQLPQNTKHFHQFVYIKNGELVRGASKPFLFEVTSFIGQPEKMIEYGRQQQEIRKQIEKIERECQYQQQLKGQQEPTLQQLISQLRQNEERISNLKQQFEELRGCQQQQQQPRKWTQYQQGVQQIPTCLTGLNGLTGLVGETFVQQQQQQMSMPYGQPEGLYELQQNLENLKYGLQGLKCEIPRKQKQVYQPINWENVQLTPQNWEQQIYQHFERKLTEQQRREQEYRQRDLLMIQSQIKSCQRQLYEQEKREMKQKQFEEQYLQQQIVQFGQKLQNIKYGKQEEQTEEIKRVQQYQITRFEGLLRERLNLENEKRQRIYQQIHQKLRELEQRMKEYQQEEQQFLGRHHQQLKERLVQLQEQILREFGVESLKNEKRQIQLHRLLRDLELNFVEQQKYEFEPIRQSKKYLKRMINEVECQINEIEGELMEKEVYGQIRRGYKNMQGFLPKYQTKSHYYRQQVQKLEEQIAEFKRQLRQKTIQQVCERIGLVGGQQWCTPLVQKLKEFELCLRSELNTIEIPTGEIMPIRGVHIEKMLTKLGQMINFFEGQYEIPTFEETKCRFVLTQLRELECGLNEFYQKHSTYWTTVVIPQGGKIQQQRQIRELVNEVQQIVSMRIRHFVELLQHFVEIEQQQPKCEEKLWKEIRNLECQLYGIKQLDVEIEFGEYKQWLNEFERKIQQQTIGNIFNDECKIVGKQEQLYQLIRELKGFWQQYKKLYTRGFFHLQNEYMQQYRFLTKLVVLVEQQMVEFHTKLVELKMKMEQTQYQTILKKQLQLFQQIKNLKYYLPYEQQEIVSFLIRQKVQQVVQDCERFLPVDMELYQPIHKQVRKLVKHLKTLEIQQGEEQTQWEIKQVLKQHFTGLRQLQQQIRECERIFGENLIEGTYKVGQYVPTYPKFHLTVKQQIKELYQFIQNHIEFFGLEQPEFEFNGQQTLGYLVGLTCDLTLPKFEDLNNNTVQITFEPSTIKEWTWNTLVELLYKFNKLGMIEQETIVSELVHRYVQCLKKSTGCEEEIRRKIEQLYVENNKLGHMLRTRIQEVAELKKHCQELQIAKSLLEMRYVQYQQYQQTGRKYETIERPMTSFEKRQFTVEQPEYFEQPKISITVERVTPVQPEDEEEEYYKPTIRQNVTQIIGELEYQLNKMRMQPEEFPRQTPQGWFVRSQSGQEFPTKVNFCPEECLRTVEGTLLVKQQPKPYQIRDDIYINQLQKKLNKLAGQTGIEQETTLFSL